MTALQVTDIDRALEFFERTRQHITGVTAGLSEAQWRFKPAPDRWSIAEILEHMVTVEERVLGPVLQRLPEAPPPASDADRQLVDRIVLEKIPDRSLRATAPDMLHPQGSCTPSDALARLSRNYQQLTSVVQSTPDLRDHAIESPPLRFITNGAHQLVDGYQLMLLVVAHDERHVRQMEEVQAAADYPRAA